ncbi:N(4)-(beta-N-acetylglucosaminyl)-L-asparaginase, partial [Escherichia coli]|nr:N(4)-(beta-N-acetylglucosaminyl)-L-asparaginase [Escherichia coli]
MMGVAAGALPAAKALADVTSGPAAQIVSTWDFGAAANDAAYAKLASGGS